MQVTRTCGQCFHWQECEAKDGIHGECCADVPFWAQGTEDDLGKPGWFVRKDEIGADVCDRFVTPRMTMEHNIAIARAIRARMAEGPVTVEEVARALEDETWQTK
jgi:hypothetical protein